MPTTFGPSKLLKASVSIVTAFVKDFCGLRKQPINFKWPVAITCKTKYFFNVLPSKIKNLRRNIIRRTV